MKSRALELIKKSNKILLLTHESPDGDAIGSVLAFYNYFCSINKSVDMIILNIPRTFDFLPRIDCVSANNYNEYDLGIVLDCASKERIGQNEDMLSKCKNTLCIDHHVSNTEYCNINIVEGNVSSCCQVIYYLFKEWKFPFNKDILTCLMSGVLTDTIGFSINTVDKETFNMASESLSFGINIYELYNKLLCKKTMSQHKLMNIAIDRLEFMCNDRIAFTYLLKEDFDDVDALYGDHEGIVDIGRNIEGVLVSVFIREDDGFTISLRSTGSIDVRKIAESFGGGGHFMASGGKLHLSFKETKDKVISAIKKEINS